MRKASLLCREMYSILGGTRDLTVFTKSLIDSYSLPCKALPFLGAGGAQTHRVRWISSASRTTLSSSVSAGSGKVSSREQTKGGAKGETQVENGRTRDGANSLRMIPGIGLKYEALLVSKGISTIKDLTKAFYEENNGSQDRMVGYLQVCRARR
jgi:hypothetical protein